MLYHSFEKLVHLKQIPDGIQALYVNTVLRRLGLSIVGIFYPVFIFLRTQETFGDTLAIGLYGVVVYFFIWQLVKFVITIPTAKFLSTKGYRKTMAVGNAFLIVLLALLTFYDGFYALLLIIAVIHAFETSFYWMAYHSLFADDGKSSSLGEELSILKLLERFAGIFGPALGGLILTIWGFHQLFLVALIIVVFSVIPFFFMHKHKHKDTISVSEVIDWFEAKRHRGELISILGKHIDDKITAIFWPIYVFLVLGAFSKQGFVEAFALVLGSASVFLAGYFFDKRHSRDVFKFGVISTAVLRVMRGFATSFSAIIVIDSLGKIFSPYYWLTFGTVWYEHARRKGESVLLFTVINQLFAAIATFIVLGVVFLLAEFDGVFWVLWGMGAVGVLMTTAIWPHASAKGKPA